jgi:uncharacterized protein YegL
MKKGLTEIAFVLDRSGSMRGMIQESIGGFNAFLEEQKKLPGEAKITLVLFDHEYQLVYGGKDIKVVEPLCERTYVTRGTTALLDAIGRTVDDVGKRLSDTPEEERPERVLVAILTDGLENASSDFTKVKINEMISLQREKYSWEFVFLAANQDAIAEGVDLGISGSLSMNYCCDSVGYQSAFKTLSNATTSYRTTGAIDKLQDKVDDDKKDPVIGC